MLQPIKNLLEGSLIKYIAAALQLAVTVIMLIPTSGITYINFSQSDKLLHSGIYLILFVVWAFALKLDRKGGMFLWLLVGLLTFYGIVIELIQEKWIATRTADVWDVMANSAGIVIGIIVFYKLKRRFRFKT